jgi:predicted lipoprotein with Yx(FWY)xxD motif
MNENHGKRIKMGEKWGRRGRELRTWVQDEEMGRVMGKGSLSILLINICM